MSCKGKVIGCMDCGHVICNNCLVENVCTFCNKPAKFILFKPRM